MSPTTPPPSATSVVERSALISRSRVRTSCSVDHDLDASPSGTTIDSLAIPAADRLAAQRREPVRGDDRIGHDDRARLRQERREQLAGAGEQPGPTWIA